MFCVSNPAAREAPHGWINGVAKANKTGYYGTGVLRKMTGHWSALDRVARTDPLGVTACKGLQVCVTGLARCDHSLNARLSAKAPAVEDDPSVLFPRQVLLDPRELVGRDVDGPGQAPLTVLPVDSGIDNQEPRARFHHAFQFFGLDVLELGRAQTAGNRQERRCP